jgi:lipoprotein LprG
VKRLLALGAVLVLALAGCSDKKDSDGGDGQSGDEAVALLTAAKKSIDDAASAGRARSAGQRADPCEW